MATATNKPAPPRALRLGWSDSRVFTEASFTVMPGSAVGMTDTGVEGPPFPDALSSNQDLYLGLWLPGDDIPVSGDESDSFPRNDLLNTNPAADRQPLFVDGVSGYYYPGSYAIYPLFGSVIYTVVYEGPRLLDETQVASYARAGHADPRGPFLDVSSLFSVSTMRKEFRLQDVFNDEVDSVILSKFQAAASWVAQESGVPVIDVPKTISVLRPSLSKYPITINDTYVKEVTEVKYWTEAGFLYAAPDGTYVPGRLLSRELDKAYLWPGATGWPTDALTSSVLEITYTRGVASVNAGLRGAIVLLAYDLFNGAPEIKPTAAVNALINPNRVYK